MVDARRYAAGLYARTKRDAVFLLAGFPLWAVPLLFLAIPWTYQLRSVYGSPSSPGAVALAVAIPVLFALSFQPTLTRWQRRRMLALRDVRIPDADVPRLRWTWLSARRALRAEATWRQALYHGIVGPLVGVGTAVLVCWLPGSLVLTGYYAGVQAFGSDTLPGVSDLLGTAMSVAGVVAVLAFPPSVALLAAADTRAAERLLGPSPTETLSRQVELLSAARAAAVEAADAERRRIERDLHDGAQQRLMSLALSLGIARKTLRDLPPEALRVIADTHEQAKEAMSELRHLVRGLHPAILDDRGLEASLSGAAARSAVPVTLRVRLDRPLSPAVEMAAYFVVSEQGTQGNTLSD